MRGPAPEALALDDGIAVPAVLDPRDDEGIVGAAEDSDATPRVAAEDSEDIVGDEYPAEVEGVRVSFDERRALYQRIHVKCPYHTDCGKYMGPRAQTVCKCWTA